MDIKKINVILQDFEKSNPELYKSSERVSMICYSFAQELNLPYNEREIAYFSGLLHRIGQYYLKEVNNISDCENEYLSEVLNGSMICFDKEFAKLIPVIGNESLNDDYSVEKYGYNVKIIKIILILSEAYDEYRMKDYSHEKTCELLRLKYKKYNNMVTSLLKAVIKNKLNYEY